jgi:beta-fructofuranosidase
MLDLPDHWVWDFWVCRDDLDLFHAFFLKAPRSLGDPQLRHRHASVGHATSPDLSTWTRVEDALGPQPEPAFDDLAVWTGSTVRAPGGEWRMFTTGLSRAEDGRVQRIGVATSGDLSAWRRSPMPLLEADPRWYAVVGAGQDETHWRDPWVFCADDGVWHLLATARSARTGGAVIAHALSRDLGTWEVVPPLSLPSRRFAWAEVLSVTRVEGCWALLFSCLSDQMPSDPPGAGGVWSMPVPDAAWTDGAGAGDPLLDLDAASRLTTESLYVGKLVPLGDGTVRFLAFHHQDGEGRFVGGVVDPLAVEWTPDGSGLRLTGAPATWTPGEPSQPD